MTERYREVKHGDPGRMRSLKAAAAKATANVQNGMPAFGDRRRQIERAQVRDQKRARLEQLAG
eukprot:1868380-Pyramimonas_sp.AAC.1